MEKRNVHFHEKNKKEPRKIMRINSSKYEMTAAVHTNKKYWKNVFEEIDAVASDTAEESKRLAKVLPNDLYKKVCNTLDIPVVRYEEDKGVDSKDTAVRRSWKEPMLSKRKCLYINRELDSDTDVEYCPSVEDDKMNIHQELLSKPEREQISWPTHYLQPEREDEKSLIRKADDLTDRIVIEFCKYMKELGGDQQSQLFTPKAIKELFQIEFDTHVARSLRVVTKELPCVEETVANVTNQPERARYAALDRQITNDIIAEHRPDKITAFGSNLPQRDRWKAPKNNTNNLWRSARHVPKDLVTLKTVWEGITNLRSVKEYCRWMIEHPEHRRAPYLSSLGMFDSAVLGARLTFEARSPPVSTNTAPDANRAPIEQIRRRLSQLAETT